jgi:hypothetical protein
MVGRDVPRDAEQPGREGHAAHAVAGQGIEGLEEDLLRQVRRVLRGGRARAQARIDAVPIPLVQGCESGQMSLRRVDQRHLILVAPSVMRALARHG